MPAFAIPAPPSSSAHASLSLRFVRDGACTRLVERVHAGPLRVQKALYPEGPDKCHAIVVHPPGGVVGGDTLAIDVDAQVGAHTVLCTPGAAKWYRANGKPSAQRVRLNGAAGSAIEWLPQETILFDGADVRLEHTVDLAAGARYLGLEIICFGRRASGERFRSGRLRQHTAIRLDGVLVWWEQGLLAGGSAAMHSAIGLAGSSVCATLLVVGPPLPPALIAAVRALDSAIGASQLKAVFVVRLLIDDSETARRLMLAAWQLLRPHAAGCAGVVPRIWRT